MSRTIQSVSRYGTVAEANGHAGCSGQGEPSFGFTLSLRSTSLGDGTAPQRAKSSALAADSSMLPILWLCLAYATLLVLLWS